MNDDYIKEKVKANYEQVKILAAALLAVGLAAITGLKELDFDKENYDLNDKITYWLIVVSLIIVAVIAVAIANKIKDSNVLIEQLRQRNK